MTATPPGTASAAGATEAGTNGAGASDAGAHGAGANGTGTNGAGVNGGGANGAGQLAEDAGLAAERERLARQLRDTRMQLAMTQARLSALEQSSTMRFGRTIANAAKKPWPRGALLPRDLFKLWKERGTPKSGAQNAATALAAAQLADLKGTGGRFLSALTAPGALSLADPALALAGHPGTGGGLVITGALSALGCATLAPDAVVHPLLPHDADVLVDGTGADLVLIEASALLPGAPWAYATDPAAADRGRRLARMIVMARALGKPVVLIRDVPASLMPGLGWLAASCDAVVDSDLGVQFARFNPVGVTSARGTAPVYAGARDPRESPGVRALLDSLTGDSRREGAAVRLTGARSWRALPALYREHAVFVTASAAQGLAQAASGARVIGPIGAGTDAATVRGQLEAARGARPLSPGEIRVRLRDIFTADATPARLAALVQAAGLPAELVSGRQIGVLAAVSDGAQARSLASVLLAQRLRPVELIVAAGAPALVPAVYDGLGKLADQGVRVVVTPSALSASAPGTVTYDTGTQDRGIEWARPLARLATASWLAPWTRDASHPDASHPDPSHPDPSHPDLSQPDAYLLDLACARECAQADAVGFGTGEYEFNRWLEKPALVRADVLKPGGAAAGDWGSHGLRLFTITAQRAGQ